MTPLIDELRDTFLYDCEGSMVDIGNKAADALEKLREYVVHDDCAIANWLPRGDECPPCTCGLADLLNDIGGKGGE